MQLVKYARYREYELQRVQANDTMMGLLAGSRLASQTLMLTEGSAYRLSEIFPAVPHIGRFDLTTARARKVLDDAEHLLGVLAIPQVIALHEDMLKGMVELLARHSLRKISTDDLKAANVHERFESATSSLFTTETLELFHLVRVARNTHIHSGGKADSKLVNRYNNKAGLQALALWQKISGMPFPVYGIGDPVRLGVAELIGILAVTRRLAEEANGGLQAHLPASAWIEVLIDDWMSSHLPGNEKQKLRQILGLARTKYGPLGLPATDIEAAARGRNLL